MQIIARQSLSGFSSPCLTPSSTPPDLVADLRDLIAAAWYQAAVAVNTALTLLYWRVGDRIRREVLGSGRAGYGQEIVVTVLRQLVLEFGRGFTEKNLRRMIQLAEAFPDEEKVATLSRQ